MVGQERRARPTRAAGGGGGGGGADLGSIIARAQLLREKMAHSLEAETAAVSCGAGDVYGLPPSLDPGLIIDSTLGRGRSGDLPAGGFDALGQLFFDKRPAECAGEAQFGSATAGAFQPSMALQEAVKVRVRARVRAYVCVALCPPQLIFSYTTDASTRRRG